MTRENPKEAFVLVETDAPHLAKIAKRLVDPLKLAHAGNGYKQIAEELLMIPIGTVRSRIHRARAHVLKLRAEAAATVPDQAVA